MGTEFFKVEIRKHVKVSGDLGTTGLVCPFLGKTEYENNYRKLFATLFIIE